MATQPQKNISNPEKNFSHEVKYILEDYIPNNIFTTVPSTSIDVNLFTLGALGYTDSIFYKALNLEITSLKIDDIYDELMASVKDKYEKTLKISILSPFNAPSRDTHLNMAVKYSEQLMKELEYSSITSDVIMMAIIEKKYSDVWNVFEKYGITVDIIKNRSNELHEAMSLASEKYIPEPDQKDTEQEKSFNRLKEFAFSNKTRQLSVKSQRIEIPYCIRIKPDNKPFIGRKKEMEQIYRTLSRKERNCVLLIGDSGVGKTAIVNALAENIKNKTGGAKVENLELWKFDTISAKAGTQFRGMFEERVSTVCEKLKSKPNAVLFIDDIHEILNNSKNDYDISEFFNHNFKIIATTTYNGFHASIENESKINSAFQKIHVDKLSSEECSEALKSIIPSLEKFHEVKYCEEAPELCARLAERYITDKQMPLSAIDILDEAGAMKEIKRGVGQNATEILDEMHDKEREKLSAIMADNVIKSLELSSTIASLAAEINDIKEIDKKISKIVTTDDIYMILSEMTGIPVSKVSESEKETLSGINSVLKKSVIGQDEAVDLVCKSIKRNKIGLSKSDKPIFSGLFIGSTGCGKTLLAKKLAYEIFGDEKYLIRFDMSEYSDKTSVNKLIGASAGYVGYNEGGLLTEAVKKNKYAVVLIDEIEKAHEEVYNLFLQVLDEGFITDNTGKKVDFRNTILILTSNVGAKNAAGEKAIGFGKNDGDKSRNVIEREMKNKFPPEFLNRLDEIVFFNNLSDDNLRKIIEIELNNLNSRLEKIGYSLKYDDSVVNHILSSAMKEKEYGARPINRIIRKDIEDRITDIILMNDYEHHEFNAVELCDGEIQIL